MDPRSLSPSAFPRLWLLGGVFGASVQLSLLVRSSAALRLGGVALWTSVVAAALVGGALFAACPRFEAWLLRLVGIAPDAIARYLERAAWTFSPCLLVVLSGLGMRLKLLVPLVILGTLVLKATTLLVAVAHGSAGAASLSATLSLLFFFSGFAALIYQIVWQRVLFAAFGMDIETVTVVVSVFMLGLGIGSLAGGVLSVLLRERLPHVFLACELGTGLFGAVSVRLIEAVAEAGRGSSLPQMVLAVFGLLLPPTILMGATLPVLTAFLHRIDPNLGRSVGMLYALNTAGSALACFLTTDILFVFMGREASVFVAAACNIAVGVATFVWTRALVSGAGAAT